jgi:hypothetical protein
MYSGLREVQTFGVGQKLKGPFAHCYSQAAKVFVAFWRCDANHVIEGL